MFFFLSKFLPLFVYPVGLVLILLIAAVVVGRRRNWQTAVLVTAFLLLYLGSTRLVSYALARTLEWQYLPPEPMPQVDVIVVLGGGTDSLDYPQQIVGLNESGDRLLYAAWLYQQGVSDQFLLTGGLLPGATLSDAEEMMAAMKIMGVPEEAMWLETASLNTYENALYSREILSQKGIDRILLLTSAFHMPRAVGVFEKQGFEVIPAPTDYFVVVPEWNEDTRPQAVFGVFNLLPTVDALYLTTRVMKEYIGLVVYRLRGWL
jgi:uncharacterized SAM-binding protein YcdF (DUF218 family)